MVYDNTRNIDVVAEMQDRMGWYHNNVFSGIDPLGASPSANQPLVPEPKWDDCTSSHYGDSGQLQNLSALVAALKGDKAIGMTDWNALKNLPCGALSGVGTNIPVGRRLFPSFFDIHTQKTFASLIDMGVWSMNFHDKMATFVTANGLGGKRVVFGETNPVDIVDPALPVSECPPSPWTKEQAETMLHGVPNSANGFINSYLFANYGAYVIMRPWQDTSWAHSKCILYPNTLNPPFNSKQ
jgi:hypothetical protein